MKKRIISALALVGLFILPALASAASLDLGMNFGETLGMGTRDIRQTIASIINVALGLLGIVSVIIILYGGFRYMISQGDKTKTEEARKIIISGVIGLVIILAAYAIASFVINSLKQATAN